MGPDRNAAEYLLVRTAIGCWSPHGHVGPVQHVRVLCYRFGKAWAAHRGRDAELPYDNHFLHALCAPRCLLLTDAYEDFSANPAGTYAAAMATRPVYALLGCPEGIGWAYREGGHNHSAEDYEALLDFMDMVSSDLISVHYRCDVCRCHYHVQSPFCCAGWQHVHHRKLTRNFQRPLYPELASILLPAKGKRMTSSN